MNRRRLLLSAGSLLALQLAVSPSRAQSLIKNPTAHPHYTVELEPHIAFDVVGVDHFGLGGRATFPIVDPGFVSTINNSVGIGVGLAWLDGDEHCPAGACYDHDLVALPAVLQWNFWFTRHWAAFAEPGLTLNVHNRGTDDDIDLDPALAVGGRFDFNEAIGLTLRLGVPYSSFGVSFFL
jgi:hypothetical protein